MWHQGLVSLRAVVLKTCRPQNNSEFLLTSYYHLEEFLPETTSEVFQLFKAELCFFYHLCWILISLKQGQ